MGPGRLSLASHLEKGLGIPSTIPLIVVFPRSFFLLSAVAHRLASDLLSWMDGREEDRLHSPGLWLLLMGLCVCLLLLLLFLGCSGHLTAPLLPASLLSPSHLSSSPQLSLFAPLFSFSNRGPPHFLSASPALHMQHFSPSLSSSVL